LAQKKFPDFQTYCKNGKWDDYSEKISDYNAFTTELYASNNKTVVQGGYPELFEEMLTLIMDTKPAVICFSIVYSSQAFFCYALLKKLTQFTTVIGGPAVNHRLARLATKTLGSEQELLNFLNGSKPDEMRLHYPITFEGFPLSEYFSPRPVLPLKTSTTCYHKKCTFCSHFAKVPYHEYPLEQIEDTLKVNRNAYFFLIDDMIPSRRILQLGKLFKKYGIQWACQLRPTKDFTPYVMKELYDAGLRMAMWGVESGSQRILDLILKGTNVEDIAGVLQGSHDAHIKNVAYIIFGFPTETKEEFLDTISFLKMHKDCIDLVTTSIFGLHKGTPIYNNPESYDIGNISEEERTVLDPKINFIQKKGLTQKEASKLRYGYRSTLLSINSYPKEMNFFREHMLCNIAKNNSTK